jgi:methyltransferase (TIGR00027 family)
VPRNDNDSWAVTESVGSTALAVAAARAAATECDNPLIDDPFARVFLDAVGEGMWNYFASPDLPAELTEADPDLGQRMQSTVNYVASRTAFFDEFFIDAAAAGVDQVVVLAAGLDSRGWRLPWPEGTVVYELDQPEVLEFKFSTLRQHGAEPTAKLINVAVDLRKDWPEALRQAGFDRSAPAAWSVEGLLPFLPAAAQELLLERVNALSAPGGRIAVEAPGPGYFDPDMHARQHARMQRIRDLAARRGEQREIPAPRDLWYLEDRADVGDWLRDHGWQVSVVAAKELMSSYDRAAADIEDSVWPSLFVSARR